MIRLLEISDFGIIGHLEITLYPGLNVLTGETGAGKSLIVEAIDAILGGRISVDMVRLGSRRARIQAVFSQPLPPGVTELLAGSGIELEDELYLSREIGSDGRGVCRINGSMVPLQTYRSAGELLADIHGQHDTQSLLRQSVHIDMLDIYAGAEALSLRQQVSESYRIRTEFAATLTDIRERSEERLRRIDYLRFQVNEIDEAGIVPEEVAALEEERNILSNAERLYALADQAYEEIYGREATAAVESLSRAVDAVGGISAVDSKWKQDLDRLESLLADLEDYGRTLAGYRSSVEFDPQRLAQIQDRLDRIGRLCTKYGGTPESLIDYRSSAVKELASLEEQEYSAGNLEKDLHDISIRLLQDAGALSRLRQETAVVFSQRVAGELKDLGLLKQVFSVTVSAAEGDETHRLESIGPKGMDNVEMMISLNPGQPAMPLRKVASGGELSRLALSIKTVLAEHDMIPVMIFDEIDAGIGGRIGGTIAERMKRIAAHRQVICITHTPQIAAAADNHMKIVKSADNDSVSVHIERLMDDERLRELSSMIGVNDDDVVGRDIAARMIFDSK
ncbi:MAG: DNA repair protein RecN [bacterium]|nr:DNA repair protein RecN [bacterium]